jgi:hypothetical protein
MSSRPRKALFLRQNVEMLQGLFLCTVGGRLRCGICLGAYQAHHPLHAKILTVPSQLPWGTIVAVIEISWSCQIWGSCINDFQDLVDLADRGSNITK